MAVQIAFLREKLIAPEAAPLSDKTVRGWAKHNLFATPKDAILSVVVAVIAVWFLLSVVEFLFINAVWVGKDRTFCATVSQGGIQPDGWSGACWAYVGDWFTAFMVGSYPRDQIWRPILIAVLFVALLVPFLIPSAPRKGWNAALLLVGLPILAYILLLGGSFGLTHVETSLWGGLMVTLILSFVGIVVSLPFGIVLALGRRSDMPILRGACIGFIELVRGVPLITVLFMASVLLPLFLTPGTNIDKFLRALVGVSIFASAYMAEVIRGGLQAIPRGQYEGADSLGLNYFQKMTFIIMPQAIKLVVPGIVNTFIGMFKDTSLVSIINMYDLLGIVKASFGDSRWLTPVTPLTGLIFAGFVFWLFCFGMSRYSYFMERHLDTGHRK
ncbi:MULTISPECIES: amino acid ABC transporter permease [Rhizobium]|uniref:Amino acid ABC transporter permease n=1 Tax=Rhizobium rhododendri TaxID=2506430 RepID=A0ABY8IKY8_9HYPH|nr:MULTISPECIES: amino acid ABC transporter permease [Rhizobium]MBO9098278.1 amino acid ABC transporter permease [Rhizobium sp. L58/93]MBO9132917.1 amino acid ABC transporter permease [Rhizobium sp. B209b/85]MBO9168544.1 amino acid ABC transporter permease [Rhizobium sp. L245/93]MBO9184474.1 amino acid ABC transporter permease [Rhizobium sp. E27B/91]MBZ5761456.1 amino acid ABC transporter permease [Rhizobium sp. VS19-DR96]